MKLRITSVIAAVLMTLPLASGVAAAQEEDATDCIRGRQIQQAISNGEIMELAEAMRDAGVDGKPLSEPEVCRIDGQAQYRVNIMNASGEAERIVLNAQAN